MSTTTFIDGTTIIVASWLNDVNTATYTAINSNVGTFGSATATPQITVNALGKTTAITSVNQTVTLTGDITTSGPTSGTTATLATVNGNVGTFGSSALVPVITTNAKGLITSIATVAVAAVPGYLCVRDEKATTTAGGASVAADITQTRTLNTVQSNTIAGASLASNIVTLPAGTYQVRATVPSTGAVGPFQAFLYNSSDSTYALIGSSGINREYK
jgi:hypothetical protein